jgi:hypothetical protein
MEQRRVFRTSPVEQEQATAEAWVLEPPSAVRWGRSLEEWSIPLELQRKAQQQEMPLHSSPMAREQELATHMQVQVSENHTWQEVQPQATHSLQMRRGLTENYTPALAQGLPQERAPQNSPMAREQEQATHMQALEPKSNLHGQDPPGVRSPEATAMAPPTPPGGRNAKRQFRHTVRRQKRPHKRRRQRRKPPTDIFSFCP